MSAEAKRAGALIQLSNLVLIQSLFEGQSASWDVAKKEQNRTKNRYGNIIACESQPASEYKRKRIIDPH